MTVVSSKANQPLAIVHGSPFPASANIPASLVAALCQVAQTERGIRYIKADGTETVQSYADLLASAKRIAIALQSRGLGNGNRKRAEAAKREDRRDFVILQFSQSVDLIAALWGCFLSGCIPVPISAQASNATGQTMLGSAIALLETPTLLTDTPEPAESLPVTVLTLGDLQAAHLSSELVLSASSSDDIALLLLTSGSTGQPKGVQLTHQNIRVSAYGMAAVNQLDADDITLNWMPLEHVASLVMFHLTEVYLGCEQIHVARETVLKDPLTWLDLLAQYKVSATWAPNFAYGLINDQLARPGRKPRSWDLSSIRWMGKIGRAHV